MPTLPQAFLTPLRGNLTIESQPALTWQVDPDTQGIRGKADGLAAMTQAVEIALSVERFRHGIYSANFGIELEDLVGQPPGFAAAELLRRVTDALSVDDRVLGVDDFTYTYDGERLIAAFTVRTVFGEIPQEARVNLS